MVEELSEILKYPSTMARVWAGVRPLALLILQSLSKARLKQISGVHD